MLKFTSKIRICSKQEYSFFPVYITVILHVCSVGITSGVILSTASAPIFTTSRAPIGGSIFPFPRGSVNRCTHAVHFRSCVLVKVQFIPIFSKQIRERDRAASLRGVRDSESNQRERENSSRGKLVSTFLLPFPSPAHFYYFLSPDKLLQY